MALTFPANTVMLLNAPNGSVVYVVGTSNLANESEEHVVAQVINAVKPDSIVLQMPHNILPTNRPFPMPVAFGGLKLGSLKSYIAEYGIVRGLFDYVLINIIKKRWYYLTNIYAGKYRKAIDEAKKYDSSVHFGDRPIHITINRAVTMLPWKLKFRLLSFMLLTAFTYVEQFGKKDLLDILMVKMSADFSVMKKIMDLERSMFFTHVLQASAGLSFNPYYDSITYPPRPKVVVAVVELSHMADIKRYWRKMTIYYVLYVTIIPPLTTKCTIIKSCMNFFVIILILWIIKILGARLLPTMMFHSHENMIQ